MATALISGIRAQKRDKEGEQRIKPHKEKPGKGGKPLPGPGPTEKPKPGKEQNEPGQEKDQ